MRRPGSIVHTKKLLRKVIYKLKWAYGFPADVYRDTQGDYDPQTGLTTVSRVKYHIDRMIVLPGLVHRDFFFSISVIRANSNFIVGGDVNLDDRQFIIDGRDLPSNFELSIDDYIIKDNERWDFKSVDRLEGGTGYFVSARKLMNQKFNQIWDGTLKEKLVTTSEFTVGP